MGTRVLAASPHLPRLAHLQLWRNAISAEALALLRQRFEWVYA